MAVVEVRLVGGRSAESGYLLIWRGWGCLSLLQLALRPVQ